MRKYIVHALLSNKYIIRDGAKRTGGVINFG